MTITVLQVQQAIQAAFPGANTDGIVEQDGRVQGDFVWPEFATMDFENRLAQFTKLVRDPLGVDGVNLGLIVPLAPGETSL